MDFGYGKRHNSNQYKQSGFYGEIPTNGGVMTEQSIGVNVGGSDMQIPSIVPGLTRQELDAISSGGKIPDSVVQKAVASALRRKQDGMSPFWGIPEKRYPMPE